MSVATTIENNSITGVELSCKDKYKGIYLTEKNIPLEDYQESWYQSFINKNFNTKKHPLFEHIHNRRESLSYYLFYKYRNEISPLNYMRVTDYIDMPFYCDEETIEERNNWRIRSVRSYSILKNITINCYYCGQISNRDYQFYWGSMINFQEYNLGDVIRWSKYSFGRSSFVEARVSGVSLSPCPCCENAIKIIIFIKNNQIAEVIPQDESNMMNVYAVVGSNRKPWRLWPKTSSYPYRIEPLFRISSRNY